MVQAARVAQLYFKTTPPVSGTDLIVQDSKWTANYGGFGGGVSKANLEAEFKTPLGRLTAGEHLAATGNGYIRQRYVPASNGSARVAFTPSLKGSHEELYFGFDLFLESGWQWVKGGKFVGLAGGSQPTGGNASPTGFSARHMWRAGGELSIYAYHPDQGAFGTHMSAGQVLVIGSWQRIIQHIKMNTGSSFNGHAGLWHNGTKYVNRTDFRWRNPSAPGFADYAIDALLYASFYGGSDASWAPSTTTFARYRDFRIGATFAAVA